MSHRYGKLPFLWCTARIGDLCDLRNGWAFKPSDWSPRGLPIVRIQNLNNPDAPFNYFDGQLGDRFRIEHGSLLFAWSGTPGTSFGAHIWGGGGAFLNQHIFRVDFDERALNKTYFRYAINSCLSELIEKAHGGVGLRHVTKGKFEDTEIPLPPFPEQRRIVAKLEELFSELDSAVSSLEVARNQLQAYRQAVLATAFADDSLQARLLPELLAQPMTNGYSGSPTRTVTPWKVLSLSATTAGVFAPEHFKYLDEPGLERRDIWCEPGDILVQRGNTREYVGVPAIYTGQSRQFIFPDLMIRLRPNLSLVTSAYLYYTLASPHIRNELRLRAKGSAGTMPKISQKILAELEIPYCPLEAQRRLTQRIEAVLSHADATEHTIDEQLAVAAAMRKALLAKAFCGGLVPQDPSDEPASKLLERIRAERAIAGPKRKAAARRTSKNGRQGVAA